MRLAVGVFTVTADWTAEPQNLNRVTTNAGSPGRWVSLGLRGRLVGSLELRPSMRQTAKDQ